MYQEFLEDLFIFQDCGLLKGDRISPASTLFVIVTLVGDVLTVL